MTQVDLDSAALDQLKSEEAEELLDTIDKLRELQVGEIVHLPQIIVVGDQSSGKSSVLEAISRVRFPVKGGLCTRFATEVILRRATTSSVNVNIQLPPKSRFSEDSTTEKIQQTSFDRDALPELIEEAKKVMGLGDRGFSKDVLRIEISGPDVLPLTLVDLPGFFHAGTSDQSLEEKDIVDQLVESYMKQKNSIILAVVSASNQLAGQKVLTEAFKHDPYRTRTLGIITKPDLPETGSSDERKFLQLARGQEAAHTLTLGWHVLRNLSEGEGKDQRADRDAKEEQFFRTGPWTTIPSRSRGIEPLRRKLSEVLLTHIQKTLPGLIVEIEANLTSRQKELEQLGRPRSTIEDIRAYLVEISDEFQRLSRDAILGRYGDKFFGTLYDNERKLRARLRNLNRAFDVTLHTNGRAFQMNVKNERSPVTVTDGLSQATLTPDITPGKNVEHPAYLQPFLSFYCFPKPVAISENDLMTELERLASSNQGSEFPGLPNPELAINLFKVQSKPWKEISEFHLRLVTDVVKVFVEDLLRHIIGGDQATLKSILRNCIDPFFEKKCDALSEKLEELLLPYTEGYGLPLEDEFQDAVTSGDLNGLADQLAFVIDKKNYDVKSDPADTSVGRENVHRLMRDNVRKFGTDRIVNMMQSYYKISRTTFTDNVINLALESRLVRQVPDILNSRKVNRMDEHQLRDLASETAEVQADRELLERQVKILSDGLLKCQQFKPRTETILPASFTSMFIQNEQRLSNETPEKQPPPLQAPQETSQQGGGGIFGNLTLGASKPSATQQGSGSIFGSLGMSKPDTVQQGGGLFAGFGKPVSSFGSRPSKPSSQSSDRPNPFSKPASTDPYSLIDGSPSPHSAKKPRVNSRSP